MSKTGYIYKIVSTDIKIKECYIGSTINFRTRKNKHKSSCNNENSKIYNLYLYQFIRDNNGWDSFSMVQIEEFKFNTRNELNGRERYWIEQLQATLNKVIPTRTVKEYYEDNKDKKKQYREDNKAKAKDYREHNKNKIKDYRENNKEEIKDKAKDYRENNKNKINDKAKDYYESNKDIINLKRKERYEKNKDILKEKSKERYELNKEEINKKGREYHHRNKDILNSKKREQYQKNLKFYNEYLEYLQNQIKNDKLKTTI